jgi:CubicO group peptidase (beta-lactamase class C family)
MWGIASNSKLFTALAVALLIDRKSPTPHSNGTVLSFHTKVKDVLPWWGVQDPYAEEHLTILDMLSGYTPLGLSHGSLRPVGG